MIFYTTQYSSRRIDYGKTIHATIPLVAAGAEGICLWKQTLNPISGHTEIRIRMHSYMERKIKGVRYKVYSAFGGGADFRELYEKCLASRLLRLHGQDCCAKSAAGD